MAKSSRPETPDLFDTTTNDIDVMAQLQGSIKPIKDESVKTIKEVFNKEITPVNDKEGKQVSDKTHKQYSNKTIEQALVEIKEKTTFNLSKSTLKRLDNTWFDLKGRLENSKERITKTLIVERAIELAIDELEKKGESSFLFRDLNKL